MAAKLHLLKIATQITCGYRWGLRTHHLGVPCIVRMQSLQNLLSAFLQLGAPKDIRRPFRRLDFLDVSKGDRATLMAVVVPQP